MTKSAGKEKDSFRHEKECPSNQLKKKIIDLEKANQQLRILVEDYRSQFENVTDVVILVGADFNLLSLSPSVEKLLGYKVEDLINRPVFELKHIFTPESFQRATDKVIKVLKGENVPAGHYDFITKRPVAQISFAKIIKSGYKNSNKFLERNSHDGLPT